MSNWKQALMDTAYYGEDSAAVNEECEVLLEDGKLSVRYEDEDGWVTYSGKENGEGHFDLFCPERDGRASLHCFPASALLEGFWREEGARGFWRISLKD